MLELRAELWKKVEEVLSKNPDKLKLEKNAEKIMNLHMGVTDYGFLFFLIRIQSLVKQIKLIRLRKEKLPKKAAAFDKQEAKAIDNIIAAKNAMEIYNSKNKSKAVVAFVQFESMDAVPRINRSYEYNCCARCCVMSCCCGNRENLAYRYLRKTWPEISPAPDPTIIQWQNLSVGPVGRCIRITFIGLVSFILMMVSFALIIYSKNVEKEQQNKFPNKDCGSLTPNKTEAYQDFQLPIADQQGLMFCYCKDQFQSIGFNVKYIEF